METKTVELILAVTHVLSYTKACKAHGDADTFTLLSRYYAAVADAATRVDGRVIKVLGDAVLLTFPVDRCREVVETVRELQENTSEMWQRFDDDCRVQVKVGVGAVVCGDLGPPGDERFDIVGDALNRLFKAPWGDFELTPEVVALVE